MSHSVGMFLITLLFSLLFFITRTINAGTTISSTAASNILKPSSTKKNKRCRNDDENRRDHSIPKKLDGDSTRTSSAPTLVSGYGSRHHPSVSRQAHQQNSDCYVRLVLPSEDNNSNHKLIKPSGKYNSNTQTKETNVGIEFYSKPFNTTILIGNSTKRRVISSSTMAIIMNRHDSDDDHFVVVTENKKSKKRPSLQRRKHRRKRQQPWIPVEGLFGIYQVPSGYLYVWIVKSSIVYDAPSSLSHSSMSSSNWWSIRKITHLHIIHVPHDNNKRNQSEVHWGSNKKHNHPYHDQQQQQQRLHEEKRQIGLLRQALKGHEWFFCKSTTAEQKIVPDMTYNLQQSMLLTGTQENRQNISSSSPSWFHGYNNDIHMHYGIKSLTRLENISSNHDDQEEHDSRYLSNRSMIPWWDVGMTDDNPTSWNATTNGSSSTPVDHTITCQIRPDSRFFWNEALLDPLVMDLQKARYNYGNQPTNSSSIASRMTTNNEMMANQILLHHSIPVTSAFCGIQENIAVTDDKNNDGYDQSSKSSSPSPFVYDEVLVTRRSKFRAGTRYTKRGADATGSVANYAETEHILFIYQWVHNNHNHTNTNRNKEMAWNRQQLQQQHNEEAMPTTSLRKNLTTITSYVQTRGSIPLRWSSPTDIKTYRPRVRIGTDPIAQARALYNHIVDQLQRYCIERPPHIGTNDNSNEDDLKGRSKSNAKSSNQKLNRNDSSSLPLLLLVNLIDKKSDQGRLGRALDAVLQAVLDVVSTTEQRVDSSFYYPIKLMNVQHLWYDFHAEVKNGRWDRLSILLDQVIPTLLNHGYFQASANHCNSGSSTTRHNGMSFRIDKLQNGVIRTNCMDCLDRTNVVQSIFSRYILFQQISHLKNQFPTPLSYKVAFRQAPMSLPWITGERAHRLLWADNADSISRLYAGTPALKGDYTRTGKRTKKGTLDDGMNSLQRYYLNNFLDADRQEGIDLMIGQTSFNNLHNDIEDDDEKKSAFDNNKPVLSDLMRQHMSVKDAARFMMLGMDQHDRLKQQSDRNHVRIKVTGDDNKRHRLNLRWLPGDLQHQFRSSTMTNELHKLPDDYLASESLQAVVRRAASNVPWWVVPESVDDIHDSFVTDKKQIIEVSTTGNNAGYVFGAVMAGANAPITLAVLVISLVSIGLPIFSSDQIDEKSD